MVFSEDRAGGTRESGGSVPNGIGNEGGVGGIPANVYRLAQKLLREGKYDLAIAHFRALGDYRDSAARAEEGLERKRAFEYGQAERLMREGLYQEAEDAFWHLGDYRDSAGRARRAHDALEEKHERDWRELRAAQRRKAAKKRREKTVPLLLLALAVCGYFAATKVFLPEMRYRKALALRGAGEYERAKRIFSTIEDYRDVDALLENDANLQFIGYVGETVKLGIYPQTAAGTDDTPIDWQILARDGQRALLISRYALDAQPYNAARQDATWETCTLRKWLNDSFLNRAFTPDQREGIVLTDVDNGRDQGFAGYAPDGGRNTQDRIFLLSYHEAWTYFDGDRARMCDPTDYAIGRGAYTGSGYSTDGRIVGWWWLRSPGPGRMYTANVRLRGSRSYSDSANGVHGTVRPAMWIDLDSGILDVGSGEP